MKNFFSFWQPLSHFGYAEKHPKAREVVFPYDIIVEVLGVEK
jgi:hypothetical protein